MVRTPSTQTLTLLAVMLSEPNERWYGLELIRATGLKSGTTYPILDRLEDLGWVTSEREDIDPAVEGRPQRRLYSLTEVGAREASSAVEEQLTRLAATATPRSSAWRPRLQGAG